MTRTEVHGLCLTRRLPNGRTSAAATDRMSRLHRALRIVASVILAACSVVLATADPGAASEIERLLPEVSAGDLAPGATGFGPLRTDLPVAPILKDRETIGWVFLTSDFVSTIGYSGKPIHVLVGVDNDAVVTGAQLVEHAEPIILIGIPDSKIREATARYAGLDLKVEAVEGGSGHDLDIISGATVTIIVIDDSIVRAGLKVSRALGLGSLSPDQIATGPARQIDMDQVEVRDWLDLVGDGSVRRMTLDIGQVNEAFASSGDAEAARRPEPGPDDDVFIDLNVAPISVPTIGRSLLGEAEYRNLVGDLEPGEHAILVAGRGRYSFKGSGYVRGGLFDRIQLVQDDASTRFRDRQHRRLGALAAEGAPTFKELDIFKIPADAEYDPARPWRLQLLVQRAIGATKKSFLTFDLGYRLPEHYLLPLAQPAPSAALDLSDEAAAKEALWQRIWADRRVDIGILGISLVTLTAFFFFQLPLTRNERAVFWFRIAFLTFTLFWLGWFVNAQLSVVNILALANAAATEFSWDAFLIDPLVFILWFAVAASIVFWGRGAFCGWLCPFGALQELTNRLAKLARVPQWEVPWPLHQRLWPIKYMIFLGLFGLSLYSLPLAEAYAEVEPFKTAIVLKFDRTLPYVAFALGLLFVGLFIERFYCRYLCPLGAALAIPAKIRAFEWLDRYRECGSPCQRCAKECMVQAIHPGGQIDPNECLYCMHCQVLYQHDRKCPVCIKQRQKRERFLATTSLDPRAPDAGVRADPSA